MVQIKRNIPITKLNNHDKKVLNKYSKYYINFIENNNISIDGLVHGNYDKKPR